jgi:hypothetical protein
MSIAAEYGFILLAKNGGSIEVDGLHPDIIVKSWMELAKTFDLSS